jgi:NAD(P)-dependent dehydrogenase (short-subunit alcohol dehydrogenase family)
MVTGAGSGVGREAAMLLAAEGYDTALVGRTESKLQDTANQIKRESKRAVCEVLPVDLADAAATAGLVDRVLDRLGRIDALANVAGFAPLMPIERVTADVWRECIDANLSYVVQLTAAVWPVMSRQRGGVIVNVSSMSSVDPFPGLAIYATAKAGLNMFTRCTAREGSEVGIKAVAIAPGAIETPMLRSLFDQTALPPDKTLDPIVVGRLIRDCITGRRDFEPGQTIQLPSP